MSRNHRFCGFNNWFVLQCVPFWPDTDSMRMFVKFRDSKVVSQHFPIANLHQTVLRMDRGVSAFRFSTSMWFKFLSDLYICVLIIFFKNFDLQCSVRFKSIHKTVAMCPEENTRFVRYFVFFSVLLQLYYLIMVSHSPCK